MSEIVADTEYGVRNREAAASAMAVRLAELWFNRLLNHLLREGTPGESGIQRQFRVLRFLRRHRLEGLAALVPEKSNSDIYRTTVHNIALRYEQRTAAQLRLWKKLEESCRQRGISLTPLKGISLTLHRSIPRYARFFEDIDVLVDAENAESLISLLTVAGFSPRHNLCKDQAWLALRSMKSLNFFSKDSICSIDVHLSIVPGGFPAVKDYSGYAESALVRDYKLMIVHCLKNKWQRLDKIVDVALIESVLTDDERGQAQDALHRRGYARAYRITRALLDALVHERVQPDLERTAATILKNWFSGPQTPSSKTRLSPPVFYSFTGWHQRLRYLFCRTFLPTENDIRLLTSSFNSLLPAIVIRLARIITIFPLRLAKRCLHALQSGRPLYDS